MINKNLLFNPGPTNVSEEVRKALMTQDMSHRDAEFKEVMMRVNKNLVNVLGGEGSHSAVLFVSSGTGANEAMINGIQGKILAINHGRYSSRLCDIAKRYQIPIVEYLVPELELLDPDALEDQIKKNQDITHLMMAHHETTTGMLDPLREIGALCERYQITLLVDGISSICGNPFDLKKDNIGFCSLNPNKCLESLPGVSFVLAKNTELEKLKGKARSFYFDLYHQWECQQKKKMPYTAAVQAVFAADAAIKRLMCEGVENRIQRYKKLKLKMKEGLKQLGFELIEHPEGRHSTYLILMKMPEDFDYYAIRDALKQSKITFYTDRASIEQKRMFIATMGNLSENEIDFFLQKLKEIYCDAKLISLGAHHVGR